jgi:hypothetical protein
MGKLAIRWFLLRAVLALILLFSASSNAQSNLAPGFSKLPSGAKIVLIPLDVAIFEIDANGVLEPRPEWTETARDHVYREYLRRTKAWGIQLIEPRKEDESSFVELQQLHLAVARAIAIHHFDRKRPLIAKRGELDWTIGADTTSLRQKTGADYALLTVFRDVRSTTGRDLAGGGAGAALGRYAPAMPGGADWLLGIRSQAAHATLIELATGRVLWTSVPLWIPGRQPVGEPDNQRVYDFRVTDQAAEVIELLFKDFPR